MKPSQDRQKCLRLVHRCRPPERQRSAHVEDDGRFSYDTPNNRVRVHSRVVRHVYNYTYGCAQTSTNLYASSWIIYDICKIICIHVGYSRGANVPKSVGEFHFFCHYEVWWKFCRHTKFKGKMTCNFQNSASEVCPPPQKKRINPFVFTHPVAATGFHTNAAYYKCRLGGLRGFQTYAAVWAHYCSRKMRIQVCVPSTWISFWYPRAIKLAEFCTTKCNFC